LFKAIGIPSTGQLSLPVQAKTAIVQRGKSLDSIGRKPEDIEPLRWAFLAWKLVFWTDGKRAI
jgi:hypothetical protein